MTNNSRAPLLRRRPILLVLLALSAFAPTLMDSRDAPSGAQMAAVPATARPATSPKTPRVRGLPNLTLVKEKLIAYHDCHCDCGCYRDDLAQVGNSALAFLRRTIETHRKDMDSPGKKLAIVLDIDETALSNWESMRRQDFGYFREQFVQWQQEAKAPAIETTLALFRFARENRVEIFFITGRAASLREATTQNLETAGFRGWTGLIMRQPDSPKLAADFKSAERKKLREAGYALVLNMGDQESDLAGEPALKSFKLPNPFYYVR